jgi:hypothetical protein
MIFVSHNYDSVSIPAGGILNRSEKFSLSDMATGLKQDTNILKVFATGEGVSAFDTSLVYLKINDVRDGIKSAKKPASHVRIYPNPANNTLYLESMTGAEKISSLSMYDLMGKEVSRVGEGVLSNANPLDISGLAKGIYLLKVNYSAGSQEMLKMIKE